MNTTLETMLNDATQLRDELFVQANLGKADSKEELDIALELAADELKKSYEKIKDLL